MYRISPYVQYFALALLSGAALATLWVNLAPAGYYDFIEWHIAELLLPDLLWSGSVSLTPFLIVTDILMALFFFLIAKELWEALVLERGALSGRRVWLPMAMAGGGLLGAGLGWLWLTALLETAEEAVPGGGWTAALGSDSVLVCFFGLMVFRRRPALHLVMLLAITTDITALLVLGLSHIDLSPRLLWLLLPLIAALSVYRLFGQPAASATNERQRRASRVIWPYILAGVVSWFGVAAAELPGALGLLPLIPAVAHADRSFGLFAEAEGLLHDPLNRLVQMLMRPMILVIFLFGLIRGGVDFAAFAPTTLIMLGSLWIFKPLGMLIALVPLALIFGLRLPRGLRWHDLPMILALLAMGFTVPNIAIEASLPGGAMREAARMGLAISLLAGPFAVLLARLILRQRRG